MVLQLKRTFYTALRMELQKSLALCPGGREGSPLPTGREVTKAGRSALPKNEVRIRKLNKVGTRQLSLLGADKSKE